MANWLTTRGSVKAALTWTTDNADAFVDEAIQECSDRFSRETNRVWLPRIQTRYYQWPPLVYSSLYRLELDFDLLSVNHFYVRSQDPDPQELVIANIPGPDTDCWLEPVNAPPYRRIEINLAHNQSFDPGTAWQRSIRIDGVWGFSQYSRQCGLLVGDIDAVQTSMICSDSSRIDVGTTLLVDTEQIFVSEMSFIDAGATLGGSGLSKELAQVMFPVSDGTKFHLHETMMIDAEQMLIKSIIGDTLIVNRAVNGSKAAGHDPSTSIYVPRQLTIDRESLDPTTQQIVGLNGTTPAVHLNDAQLRYYVINRDAERVTRADTIVLLTEQKAGFGRSIGTAGGEKQWDSTYFVKDRKAIVDAMTWFQWASI